MTERLYNVMLVEDEPPSMRNIEKNIMLCEVPGVRIAARAGNGEQALALMPETRPDIIFSDIKMPVMDGFGLAERVCEQYPDTLMVILSGYQDFGLVRRALHYSLFDYILKPIDRAELKNTLIRLTETVDKLDYQRVAVYLKSCVENRPQTEEPDTRHSFYCVIAINSGSCHDTALPQEYAFGGAPDKNTVYSVLSVRAGEEAVWVLEGAAMNQLIAVVGSEQEGEATAAELYYSLCAAGGSSITVAYCWAVGAAGVTAAAQNAKACLFRELVPGRSQLLAFSRLYEPPVPWKLGLSEERRLLSRLEAKKYREAATELCATLLGSVEHTATQSFVRQAFLSVALIVGRSLQSLRGEDGAVLESIVQETAAMDVDVPRMIERFCSQIADFLGSYSRYSAQDDTVQEVIEKIALYLSENFAEPVEFSSLASGFGISSTYLSTLFKKQYGMTPLKYLIKLRVDKARELIKSDPEISFKTVAAVVGYEDPHYFSRIFRSIAGCSPSEYRQSAV